MRADSSNLSSLSSVLLPRGLKTRGTYLQQGNEEKEGVGRSSELRVEEPRQERQHVVLGGAG